MKQYLLTLLMFWGLTATYAQDVNDRTSPYGGMFKILHQRTYTGQYPRPHYPKVSQALKRAADGSTNETTQPLEFNDRVWFPGEWEEVKAILVTVPYTYWVAGHENDNRYAAVLQVPGHAIYYFRANENADPEIVGEGPYTSRIDVTSKHAAIFLNIMDGIQEAGVEAWVRVESENDARVLRNTMREKGLRTDLLRFFEASGNSYWLRDCGPICFYYGDDDQLAMLDFFYDRNRDIDDMLPSILHRKTGMRNFITTVVWEGGNCLVDGVGGLVTSSAIDDNGNDDTHGPISWDGEDYSTISETEKPALTAEQVEEALHDMLGQRQTMVLPRLMFDGGTGHVDLYADTWDENGFLFTQMPDSYNDWYDYQCVNQNAEYMYKQHSFFGRNYIEMGRLPFPAKNDGSEFSSEDEYTRYTRSYANHCIVNNYIIQPCFSPVDENHMPTAEWDRANIELMKARYPGYTFYCVDMRELDEQGGSIHCVTKQIPADSPIRILHKRIHGGVSVGALTEIPFSAIITNNSGIKRAQLVYRINQGEWQTVELKTNGNRWYCSVPINNLGMSKTVEYYISATSNNGKTITKPFTAEKGGHYEFWLSDVGDYDAEMFDFGTDPMPMDHITFELGTKYLKEDTSTDNGMILGVNEVADTKAKNAGNEWYTLDGQRLSTAPSVSGIYINNGKKVVKK